MVEQSTRATTGPTLQTYDLGGVGPSALMTHGTGLCGSMFAPLAHVLATTAHSHALDFRGHGGSARPQPIDHKWTSFAEDVLATLAELELDKPIGIGHSLGATALLLAELRSPGSFSWLYCYEPIILTADEKKSSESIRLADSARKRRSVFSSRQEALVHYRDRGILRECAPAALEAFVDHALTKRDGSVQLILDPSDEAMIYENVLQDTDIDLERMSCPVAIAVGSASMGLPPLSAKRAFTRLQNARLEELSGPGHLGPMGMPELVGQSIIRLNEWATS